MRVNEARKLIFFYSNLQKALKNLVQNNTHIKLVHFLCTSKQDCLSIVHIHGTKTTENQTRLVRFAQLFYNQTVFQKSVRYFFDEVRGQRC